MSKNIARMAVSAAIYAIDRPYDYIVPDNLIGMAVPGMRVLAPFGPGNRKSEAVILSLTDTGARDDLKIIDSLIDEEPLLSDENLKLALWMSDRFFCTVFDALRAMLPAGVWYKDGSRRTNDKKVSIAELNIPAEEASVLAKQRMMRAPLQAAVLTLLAETGKMSVNDICFITGASKQSVGALEKTEIISISEVEVFRRPAVSKYKSPGPINLNSGQLAVYNELLKLLHKESPEAALLYGVTGSGKTLVYIKLIEQTLDSGKNAIVLVPEIALTPQVVSAFISYFGDNVAVLHSALSIGERYDEWKRIRSGAVRVVVGTRSAVFAPVANLGLIVIDEEQEHTYKSENNPRYHAREVAKYRAARSDALLLLSSATPSVESMYSASDGKYHLLRIPERYNEQALPPVVIADMKKELKSGNNGSIGSVLYNELSLNIENGEQSILFINRRGASPLVVCGECGYTYQCRFCSVSMTYHSAGSRLICHYCGSSLPLPGNCPDCGGKLKFIGTGTQKVESELQELFPDAGVIRMDADTVSRANSHDKLLSRFRAGEAKILLGTQMVTKGLDFENVTLVGVLSADSSLYMSDYRAHEKTFSLIAQVIGRSGRGAKPGRAVIQTFTPDHEVISLASKQDYEGFYEREISLRQAMSSPPICDLLMLTATGMDEAAVLSCCIKLKNALDSYFRNESGIKILGPAPPLVPKVNNRYRFRILISCRNSKQIRDIIAHTVKTFSRDKSSRGVSIFADSDPYD